MRSEPKRMLPHLSSLICWLNRLTVSNCLKVPPVALVCQRLHSHKELDLLAYLVPHGIRCLPHLRRSFSTLSNICISNERSNIVHSFFVLLSWSKTQTLYEYIQTISSVLLKFFKRIQMQTHWNFRLSMVYISNRY